MINKLSELLSINSNNLILIIKTLLLIIILDLIKHITIKLFKFIKNEKLCYNLTQRFKTTLSILKIVLIILIWSSNLSKITTILSVISAALTIAIRDLIFNFFSGIFIKTKKPFKVEDRIEINGHKGDVININALNFELLEVKNDSFTGQSTGVVIHIPNSSVFSYPLRNYNTAFKYIWNEIEVSTPIDYDIKKAQDTIMRVVKKNDIIIDIPEKLRKEMDGVSTDFRIYYNNLEPTIYIDVKEDHIIYHVRYLVHPKKARYVSSSIWKHIIEEYQKGKIELYKSV